MTFQSIWGLKNVLSHKSFNYLDVERKYYLNTPSREYKTYACLPLVRGFFCLVLYSGSSKFMLLCILFISGVAGQTSCPEAGRWSEFQDGELQPRRRPTGSLQRGAWWWGPAFLRGGLIVGPYREGTGLLICLAPCPGPALGLEPMLQDPGERLSAWGQEKGSSWTAQTMS